MLTRKKEKQATNKQTKEANKCDCSQWGCTKLAPAENPEIEFQEALYKF